MNNSTKPAIVQFDTSNVLGDLTTIAHFSVSGLGTGITYQVLDANNLELFAENLTFSNSFTINFAPQFIGLFSKIWVLGEREGDAEVFSIGVGAIKHPEFLPAKFDEKLFYCTFQGSVDLVTLEENFSIAFLSKQFFRGFRIKLWITL